MSPNEPIPDHKHVCRNLAPFGWHYIGWIPETDLYCFQTGSYAKGFVEMRCKAEDLTVENIKLMVELGLSR